MGKLAQKEMESNHFSLEVNKSNRLTRVFQLVFGLICALVAIIWAILNINALKSNASLWITIILLLGFAYYQVMSGAGLAEKFLEVNKSSIKLKKNSLLPAREMSASDIEKIEIFPLSIKFLLRSGNPVILRLGTTFTDIIDPIIKSVETFCHVNNVSVEHRIEEF
jgi:hypothetical protein